MKTLTIDVDDRLYETLSHRSNFQLTQMLKNSIREEKRERITPLTNYWKGEICTSSEKKKQRLADTKSKILSFSGCWADKNSSDDEFTTEAIISRREAVSRERYL